jgi:hypothetical protein
MSDAAEALNPDDFFAVVDQLDRAGSPEAVAAAYHNLLRELYWKAHDLPGLIEIGRAGILYCLAHSLRAQAKAMAYDVGSFTWPGWEEAGIDPKPADLAFGRRCASFNLALAIELTKPADKLASAHWLVGAHALAVNDSASAGQSFDAAARLVAADCPLGIYLRGCSAAARLQSGKDVTTARDEVDQAMRALATASSADSSLYLGQLTSILKLFTSAESPQ